MDIESSKKVFNEQNEAFWSYMSKKQEIDELVRLSERRPPQVPMRDSGQSMDIEKTPEPVSPNQIETCNGVFLRCDVGNSLTMIQMLYSDLSPTRS